jgi:hypothetical protein
VQLVRTLRLRRGSALGRRRLRGRRQQPEPRPPPCRAAAAFRGFFLGVGETIPDEGERFVAVEET